MAPSKKTPAPGRTKKGHWLPGVSGNAGGRSKTDHEFREACREKSPAMLDELEAIAIAWRKDAKVIATSFQAGARIIAYGHGNPTNTTKVDGVGDALRRLADALTEPDDDDDDDDDEEEGGDT